AAHSPERIVRIADRRRLLIRYSGRDWIRQPDSLVLDTVRDDDRSSDLLLRLHGAKETVVAALAVVVLGESVVRVRRLQQGERIHRSRGGGGCGRHKATAEAVTDQMQAKRGARGPHAIQDRSYAERPNGTRALLHRVI